MKWGVPGVEPVQQHCAEMTGFSALMPRRSPAPFSQKPANGRTKADGAFLRVQPAGRTLGLPCGSPIARLPLPISCDVLPAREGIGCGSFNGNGASPSRCSARPPTTRATALAPGQTIYTLYASGREFDSVFATIDERLEALLVTYSPVFTNWRSHIIALAAWHSVPTIYFSRTFAEAGGLNELWSRL
jgi:hypothetical protein